MCFSLQCHEVSSAVARLELISGTSVVVIEWPLVCNDGDPHSSERMSLMINARHSRRSRSHRHHRHHCHFFQEIVNAHRSALLPDHLFVYRRLRLHHDWLVLHQIQKFSSRSNAHRLELSLATTDFLVTPLYVTFLPSGLTNASWSSDVNFTPMFIDRGSSPWLPHFSWEEKEKGKKRI